MSYNQSFRWRALARLPADSLEVLWKDCSQRGEEFTAACAMRSFGVASGPRSIWKTTQPWTEWGERPYDKQVLDAINWLYRFVGNFSEEGKAHEMMQLVERDRTYLADYDVEEVREVMIAVRERVDLCLERLQRRLDGLPADPHENWPSLRALLDAS